MEGNKWIASARIIASVIGSEMLSVSWAMLSLPWSISQVGWIAGPSLILVFAVVTHYTSTLLTECCRSGNYTYKNAVRVYLGGFKGKFCGFVQYLDLFGVSIGSTLIASTCMMTIKRSNCMHRNGRDDPCHFKDISYVISFGIMEIFLSQIPDFDPLSLPCTLIAAVMSFTYSTIGLCLSVGKIIENQGIKGSLTGVPVIPSQKFWRIFAAPGNIAFAYSYLMILIETRETISSPPSESKTLKPASLISIISTTTFYMLCGCFGYAAFGDDSSGNLLTDLDFGFHNPFWLVDIANVAIVIHLVGAFQVYCHPIYLKVEKTATERFPDSNFINKDVEISITGILSPFKINLFKLVWRSTFVILITMMSLVLPFFQDFIGIIVVIGFWPLTVYFPVEMYIVQQKIPKWSTKWICLHLLSAVFFVICLASVVVNVASIITDFLSYEPFDVSV